MAGLIEKLMEWLGRAPAPERLPVRVPVQEGKRPWWERKP